MPTIEELKQEIERKDAIIARLHQQQHKQQKLSELGMLTAGIAHEVQNPLNFVINFSKMSAKLIDELDGIISDSIDDNVDDDNIIIDGDSAADIEDIAADLKENMQKIREHGERAISIIRNILLQSRGKEGEFMPTDINALVHEYVWLSYHAMRANEKSFNISITETYAEGLSHVSVVPQDICRAVLNLMNNACYAVFERSLNEAADYTPTINISTSTADGALNISIKDNGTGMTDEVRAKLFNTIFTTKPIGKGTGLGMSIIHQIVCDEHHGNIIIDTTPGVGTTFTIVLPLK